MKKNFSKIVGLSLGIALAIGVGAGIATSNRTPIPVHASTGSYTLTFDANTSTSGTGTSCTADGSTALTTSNFFSSGTYSFTASKVTYYWLVDGYENVQSVSSTENCYPGKNSSLKVGKGKGDGTVAFTVAGDANLSIDSIVVTAYGSGNTAKITIDEATAGTKSWTLSTDSGSHTFTYASSVKTVTLTGGAGLDSNNKIAYITQMVINYTIGGGGGADPTTLDDPTNLSASGTVLSWTNVANNNGYSYSINTTPEATTGNIAKDATSFDAAQLQLAAGTYSFSLKAKGDGASYLDSSYCAGVSFTMPNYAIDTFDVSDFPATNSTYTEFSVDGSSGATYVGYSAKNGANLQFNNNGTPKSRCIGVSETVGYLRKVSVAWGDANGKTITVYAGNAPYSSSANLNTGTAQLTTLSTSNTIISVSGDYKYVSLFPSGATYPESVSFYWEQNTFTQALSASAASAYKNETITVSSDATNPVTWSVVSGSGTTATGAAVTSEGVISVTSAGTVTVKAVSKSYNDATIQVTFTEPPANVFEVSFNSNGGSESPVAINVADGDTFEFPSAGTKEHYSFDGWTSTGSAPYYVAGATSPAVTGAITYTAHWTEDAKYTVTYSAGANGSGSYAHSSNYVGSYELLPFNSLTGVSATDGYRFKDYTVNGVHKNPGDTFDLSAAVTVTVNFEEIPLQYTVVFGDAEGTKGINDFSNTSFIIPAGVTLNNIQGNIYGSDSNEAVWLRFGKSGTVGSFDATIDSQYYIKRIVANLKYYGSDTTAKFAVTPNGGEAIEKTMTDSFADYAFDVSSSYTNKVTLGTTVNGKRAFLSGFTIEYEAKTNRGIIEHTESASALKFDYSETAGIYEYDNAAIRFGGCVSVTDWNALSNIQGYGVLVAANSDLGGQTLKQKYAAAKTNENTPEQAIIAMCTASSGAIGRKIVKDKAHPATATTEQKAFLDVAGDYYIWTVQKPFGDAFTSKFNAVAFILIDGDIVFLEEVSLSAKDIATRDVPVDDQDTYYEPIHYMANMA